MVVTNYLSLLIILMIAGELVVFSVWLRKKAQIEKSLLKKEKELKYLGFLTTDSLSQDEPIETGLTKYLNRLKEEIQWKYHSLWSVDEASQVVQIRLTGYLPRWYMKELGRQVLIKVGDASIGRAISTRQPVTINEAEQDPRFTNVASYGDRAEYQSLSCYPLIGKLKTIGGFCAYGEKTNLFTLHDVKFLLTCANVYAIILENRLIDQFLSKKPKSKPLAGAK